jgi:hypothetical protein
MTQSGRVEGEGRNREVPPPEVREAAGNPEEGGSRRKHGFPRAPEPKAEVAA